MRGGFCSAVGLHVGVVGGGVGDWYLQRGTWRVFALVYQTAVSPPKYNRMPCLVDFCDQPSFVQLEVKEYESRRQNQRSQSKRWKDKESMTVSVTFSRLQTLRCCKHTHSLSNIRTADKQKEKPSGVSTAGWLQQTDMSVENLYWQCRITGVVCIISVL